MSTLEKKELSPEAELTLRALLLANGEFTNAFGITIEPPRKIHTKIQEREIVRIIELAHEFNSVKFEPDYQPDVYSGIVQACNEFPYDMPLPMVPVVFNCLTLDAQEIAIARITACEPEEERLDYLLALYAHIPSFVLAYFTEAFSSPTAFYPKIVVSVLNLATAEGSNVSDDVCDALYVALVRHSRHSLRDMLNTVDRITSEKYREKFRNEILAAHKDTQVHDCTDDLIVQLIERDIRNFGAMPVARALYEPRFTSIIAQISIQRLLELFTMCGTNEFFGAYIYTEIRCRFEETTTEALINYFNAFRLVTPVRRIATEILLQRNSYETRALLLNLQTQ